MIAGEDILIIALAVILSVVIIVILLYTGLHRTPLCVIGGIGVTAMVWRSFPPAATLPTGVEVFFCILVSLGLYFWPEEMGFTASLHAHSQDGEVPNRSAEEED